MVDSKVGSEAEKPDFCVWQETRAKRDSTTGLITKDLYVSRSAQKFPRETHS